MKILLVDPKPGNAQFVREAAASVDTIQPVLAHVDRLSEAIQRVSSEQFDVALLDLQLPDSRGVDAVADVHGRAPELPILVLTESEDDELALSAVQAGAQDVLIQGEFDRQRLGRSMQYAIERHRLIGRLRTQSIVDELTGLHNRRGFLTLANQQIKVATRTRRGMLLFFADLDGLKQINDTCGHLEGDRAIKDTAGLLRTSFREQDILARIGGDEFAVLAVNTAPSVAELLMARLDERLESFNARTERRYRLSISVGVGIYDPDRPCTIEELVERGDTRMYEHKLRAR